MLTTKSAAGYLKNRRSLFLNTISAGVAEADSDWHGSVQETPYSRLYFMLDGEFYINVRYGNKVSLPAGYVGLIPSGCSYSFRCQSYMKQIYFHLQLRDRSGIDVLSKCRRPIVIPMGKECSTAAATVDAVSISETMQAEAFLYGVLSRITDVAGVSEPVREYSKDVELAIEYIKENLSARLRLSEIAVALHVAVSTLTRKFRREIGVSVSEYVDSLIMLKAEEEIRYSDRSVCDIGEMLGFCDQFYFSRRFKERYGKSPRAYREEGAI